MAAMGRQDDAMNEWDDAAATFDRSADHGLLDPEVRSAWAALLTRLLPAPPSRIADLDCGTGSLTILAAELGHRVDGIDLSEKMLEIARAKTRAFDQVTFSHGDAADTQLAERTYDVVLCRHLLWALPDPAGALQRWSGLLCSGGRIVLIEGRWSTGAGPGAPGDSHAARRGWLAGDDRTASTIRPIGVGRSATIAMPLSDGLDHRLPARASRWAISTSLAVSPAARSNSARASRVRPSLASRSPRTLGSRW